MLDAQAPIAPQSKNLVSAQPPVSPVVESNPVRAAASRVSVLELENAALRGQLANFEAQRAASPPELEKLRIENEALAAKVRQSEAEKELLASDERLIADKLEKGISRAQAIAVIRRQRAWDATPYAQAKRARVERARNRTVAVAGIAP